MKRSHLFSLVALVIAATIAGGFYFAGPSPLAARVRQLEGELSQARSEIARLKEGSAKGAAGIAATGTGTGTHEGSSDTVTARYVAAVPVGREEAFKANETRIDREYGRLFKQLGLTGIELDYFKHLLSDRQTVVTDMMMNLRIQAGVNQTAEQKEADRQKGAAAKTKSDEAVRQFLNNEEDYQTYLQWQDTGADRILMQLAVTEFDSAGETLSGDQRNQLYDLRLKRRITPEQRAAARANAKSQAEASDRFQKLLAANDQAILEGAAAFLTPGQMEVLQKMQERQRAFSEATRAKGK